MYIRSFSISLGCSLPIPVISMKAYRCQLKDLIRHSGHGLDRIQQQGRLLTAPYGAGSRGQAAG
jgi:hypothetical protein